MAGLLSILGPIQKWMTTDSSTTVLAAPGSQFQLLVGIFVSTVFTAFVGWCRPYKLRDRQHDTNKFKIMCDFSITMVLVLSVMLKGSDMQENLSPDALGLLMLVFTVLPFSVDCYVVRAGMFQSLPVSGPWCSTFMLDVPMKGSDTIENLKDRIEETLEDLQKEQQMIMICDRMKKPKVELDQVTLAACWKQRVHKAESEVHLLLQLRVGLLYFIKNQFGKICQDHKFGKIIIEAEPVDQYLPADKLTTLFQQVPVDKLKKLLYSKAATNMDEEDGSNRAPGPEEPGESKVCSTVRPRMCILRKFVAVQQQCQRKIRIRAGAGTGTAAAIIELSITNLTNQIGLGDKLRNHSASHASADATK